LAAAAVGAMQQHKIIVLPVVDEQGAIVGVVHLHDLMRAGAVCGVGEREAESAE
jgi:arabinose-5-phosphate isomerase